jgi:hypothetical protein
MANFGSNTITTTGNITGGYFLGNGSQLTGVTTNYSNANVVSLLSNFGSNTITTTGNITGGYFLGNGRQLTGITGTQGTTGAQGTTGSGTQGTTGSGTQGTTGTTGAQGVQGLQGPGVGAQGTTGAQGVQGLQGPGVGAQGTTGAQGVQGLSGNVGNTSVISYGNSYANVNANVYGAGNGIAISSPGQILIQGNTPTGSGYASSFYINPNGNINLTSYNPVLVFKDLVVGNSIRVTSGPITATGNVTSVSGLLQGPGLVINQAGTYQSNAFGILGQIAWDTNYLYVCVGSYTWKRIALSSF